LKDGHFAAAISQMPKAALSLRPSRRFHRAVLLLRPIRRFHRAVLLLRPIRRFHRAALSLRPIRRLHRAALLLRPIRRLRRPCRPTLKYACRARKRYYPPAPPAKHTFRSTQASFLVFSLRSLACRSESANPNDSLAACIVGKPKLALQKNTKLAQFLPVQRDSAIFR